MVAIVDSIRDDSIRTLQYRFDSAAGALTRRRLMAEMRRRVAGAQERIRTQAVAKKEADALALERSLARGPYIGIAGGASAPQRALRNGYTGGYNLTVPVGYDATGLPWGIRVDVGVDHMNGTRIYNALNETLAASGDITVWSLNTDLKLRIPVPGAKTRTHFYALGGIGAHRVAGGIYGTTGPTPASISVENAATKFGWNAGGGAAIAWGPVQVFIESPLHPSQDRSAIPHGRWRRHVYQLHPGDDRYSVVRVVLSREVLLAVRAPGGGSGIRLTASRFPEPPQRCGNRPKIGGIRTTDR